MTDAQVSQYIARPSLARKQICQVEEYSGIQ